MRTEAGRTFALSAVPASRYVCFALLAGGGLLLDLYSKSAIFQSLGYPRGASAWVVRFFDGWLQFRLFTSFNEGALWGIGQGYSWLFAGLSLVAIAGVLFWLFVRGAARSWWLTVCLGLIMAGTVGNLYDRLGWHGCVDAQGNVKYAVRDFLYFRFGTFDWPIFNFADVYLVTGAIMLVLHSFQNEQDAPS